MDTKELTEIVVTDTFEEWYMELDEKQGDTVVVIISLLEAKGTKLGHPYSSAISDFAW